MRTGVAIQTSNYDRDNVFLSFARDDGSLSVWRSRAIFSAKIGILSARKSCPFPIIINFCIS